MSILNRAGWHLSCPAKNLATRQKWLKARNPRPSSHHRNVTPKPPPLEDSEPLYLENGLTPCLYAKFAVRRAQVVFSVFLEMNKAEQSSRWSSGVGRYCEISSSRSESGSVNRAPKPAAAEDTRAVRPPALRTACNPTPFGFQHRDDRRSNFTVRAPPAVSLGALQGEPEIVRALVGHLGAGPDSPRRGALALAAPPDRPEQCRLNWQIAHQSIQI